MPASSAKSNQPFRLGLLGQSLAHSLSPVIHGAFFDELGLSGTYEKIEVAEASDVPAKLSELASRGYSGINVTIPYKLTVLPQMTSLDTSAELAGAVNTIKFGAQMSGFNTDVSGLAEALSSLDQAGADFFGEKKESAAGNGRTAKTLKAMVLGSGGAARAAIIAVSLVGFGKLSIVCRSRDKAGAMLEQILDTAERVSLVNNCRNAELHCFDDSLADDYCSDVSLVINATPIGQKTPEVPPPVVQLLQRVAAKSEQPAFVDLVYSRETTPLCKLAAEAGFAFVADGTEMLLNQARFAFEIWTGHLPDGSLARQRLK